MAIPVDYTPYGGTSATWAYREHTISPGLEVAQIARTGTVTWHDALTAGNQLTVYTDAGDAVTEVELPGSPTIPRVWINPDVVDVFVAIDGGPRVQVPASRGKQGSQGVQGDIGPGGGTDADVAAKVTSGPLTTAALWATYAQVFTPEKYGAIGDGATDDTTAMQATWAAACAAGGNVMLAAGTTYRCDGQLTKPVGNLRVTAQGSSRQWFSDSSQVVDSGSILDLRYAGATAKILALKGGVFALKGITLTDKGTSSNPFCTITGAQPRVEDCYVEGNPTKLLQTCDQDAFVVAGTGLLQNDFDPNAGFAGYGGWFRNNGFARIRRGVYYRNFVNGIPFVGNNFAISCGSNLNTAISAPTLNAPTTATTGGTLAAATYFYTITATRAGETTKSAEVSQVTTGATSTVGLSWAAVTGATGYRIYRSTVTGTALHLVDVASTATTYTDTGTLTNLTIPPTANQSGADAPIVLDSGGNNAALSRHVQGNVIAENTIEITTGYAHAVILRNNARKNVVRDNGFWDGILPASGGKYVSDVLCDEASGAVQNTLAFTGYSMPTTSGQVAVTGATAGNNAISGPQSGVVSGIQSDMGTRTAGNVVFSTTSYVEFPLHKTVKVAAAPGDVIELSMSGLITNENNWLYLEACTIVAAAIVNYCSRQVPGGTGSTGVGVVGWVGAPSAWSPIGGSVLYTVQAGDVSAGEVQFKVFGRLETATTPTKTLYGGSGFNPYFVVKNLG